MKKTLVWILLCSIFLNIFFVVQKLKEDNGLTYVDETYHAVQFAARAYDVDILKAVTVGQSDEYWEKKLGEICRKKSTSRKYTNQILVEYDNGETLVLEMVENLQHEFVIGELYFLKGADDDK